MTYVRGRRPPPWLFGITALPYGVYTGFLGTAMPYLLRNAGLPVDRIAGIVALALAPLIWNFLWAPVVDIGFRRRTWLIVMSALSAVFLLVALLQPLPSALGTFTALIVAGSALNTLIGAANGGLMATTMPDHLRGHAAGWYQAANTGGGALGAGVTLWLAPHLSVGALGCAVAMMTFLPSLAALAIAEPEVAPKSGGKVIGQMLHELRAMFRSPKALAGLAIFASPMGAAAAASLFSGLAADYHASLNTVVWITGLAGGLFTALGSLAGGWVCDRIPRRLAYAIAAILSALCGAGMALAPLSEPAFAIGVSLYLVVQGVAYAAYSALALELIGPYSRSAATQYTLYNAAANLPVVYMTWLDGQGYKFFGPRGLLGTDSLSNVIAVAIFLCLMGRTIFARPALIDRAEIASGQAAPPGEPERKRQ